MHTRLVRIRRLAFRLLVPVVGLAAAGQLALTGVASATHVQPVTRAAASQAALKPHGPGPIKAHFNRPNMLDCNAWGQYRRNGKTRAVKSLRPAMKGLCTDPIKIKNGKTSRFVDHGWYVGHDEPSLKFISKLNGSGNTMSYGMQLPVDPRRAPTSSGSVTKYGELSVAPWFGLPICDPNSYPQNPCTPLSDANSGSISNPSAAGSAFMELQFYPPGFTPFIDSTSCSTTKWCAALNIDSLECSFNFGTCNGACVEPVNFAFLQTNGVPAGPPSPQLSNLATFTPNTDTLQMRPGDVLKVSISDVPDSAPGAPDTGGLKASVTDVTTGQTGYIVASAANGFANTSMADCSGTPFSFHAEYNSAQKQNQVPWAALEGGVLMEQEIGHFETCNSVSAKMGVAVPGYTDPQVYQTCVGGSEGGKRKHGEGPCNLSTFICGHASTQSKHGPTACPTNDANTGAHCEFADGFCVKKGNRPVTINGLAAKEHWAVTGCTQNFAQNGDLDYDGTPYRADWPNGTANFPTSIRYVGPFTNGHTYARAQFETDAAGSEALCDIANGKNCTAPPLGAKFYPFWTLTNKLPLKGLSRSGVCVWNFGNNIRHVTKKNFGAAKQYGKADIARFGGTLASKVMRNPATGRGCRSFSF